MRCSFGQRDGQREGFPWSHGQIARESPPSTREIPHGALALEGPRVVRDGALHGKATEGANREGHGGLAGRRIVGGQRSRMQGQCMTNGGIGVPVDPRQCPRPYPAFSEYRVADDSAARTGHWDCSDWRDSGIVGLHWLAGLNGLLGLNRLAGFTRITGIKRFAGLKGLSGGEASRGHQRGTANTVFGAGRPLTARRARPACVID